MGTYPDIGTQFADLLQRFLPADQFTVRVQPTPVLRCLATHRSVAAGLPGGTPPFVDTKCLLSAIEGQVIGQLDDETMTVIEGRFEGHRCKLTILLPLGIPGSRSTRQ
jgi:hypothetical protein